MQHSIETTTIWWPRKWQMKSWYQCDKLSNNNVHEKVWNSDRGIVCSFLIPTTKTWSWLRYIASSNKTHQREYPLPAKLGGARVCGVCFLKRLSNLWQKCAILSTYLWPDQKISYPIYLITVAVGRGTLHTWGGGGGKGVLPYMGYIGMCGPQRVRFFNCLVTNRV